MKLLASFIFTLAISASFTQAHAKGGGGEVGSSNVKSLTAVSFVDNYDGMGTMMNVQYASGGCSPEEFKTTYKLQLLSLKEKDNRPSKVRSYVAEIFININQELTDAAKAEQKKAKGSISMCAMAFDLTDSVSLDKLVREQGAAIGLPVKGKSTIISIRYTTLPVAQAGSVEID